MWCCQISHDLSTEFSVFLFFVRFSFIIFYWHEFISLLIISKVLNETQHNRISYLFPKRLQSKMNAPIHMQVKKNCLPQYCYCDFSIHKRIIIHQHHIPVRTYSARTRKRKSMRKRDWSLKFRRRIILIVFYFSIFFSVSHFSNLCFPLLFYFYSFDGTISHVWGCVWTDFIFQSSFIS